MILIDSLIHVYKGILHPSIRFLYIYSGLGYLIEMIHKPRLDKDGHLGRRPSNFPLWLVGVYAGLFSVAFQRYENRATRLISTYGSYVELISGSDSINGSLLQGFIDLQKNPIPHDPDFWRPISVYNSFIYDTTFQDVVKNVGDISLGVIDGKQITHIKNFIYLNNVIFGDQDLYYTRIGEFENKGITLNLDSCSVGPLIFKSLSDLDLALQSTKLPSLTINNVLNAEVDLRFSPINKLNFFHCFNCDISFKDSRLNKVSVEGSSLKMGRRDTLDADVVYIKDSWISGSINADSIVFGNGRQFLMGVNINTTDTIGIMNKLLNPKLGVFGSDANTYFSNCVLNEKYLISNTISERMNPIRKEMLYDVFLLSARFDNDIKSIPQDTLNVLFERLYPEFVKQDSIDRSELEQKGYIKIDSANYFNQILDSLYREKEVGDSLSLTSFDSLVFDSMIIDEL